MKTSNLLYYFRAACPGSIESRAKLLAMSILVGLPGYGTAKTEITPYVSVKESLVHEKDDSSNDTGHITSIKPGVRVVSNGPRAEMELDYTFIANYSSGLNQNDKRSHLLDFISSYQHSPEKWESSLRASSRLSNRDANGRQNTNPAVDDGNTDELHTVAIDTTVTDRWTETIQYLFSLGADYTGYSGEDDSRGLNALARLDNFRSPNDFTWRTQVDREVTNESDGDQTIDNYNAYLQYRLNRIWSSFFNYVHTEVDFGDLGSGDSDFDDSDPDDAWLLGLVWQPNTKTSVSAGAGQRGSDGNYVLNAFHARQNLSFSASYFEKVTTARADTLNQQLSGFLAQSTTSSISAEPILLKRADLNISVFGQYSTISTSVFQTDRSSRSGTNDETITGGTISYSRKVSARDNVTVSLSGQEIKDDEDTDITELFVRYSRNHSKTETIIVSTQITDEDSTLSANEYERYLVSAEYRVTF